MRKSPERPIKTTELLIYAVYRAAGWSLSRIPLSWTFRLGQGFGFLGWAFLGGYRKLAASNLSRAFPDWNRSEIDRCGREHFQSLGANLLSGLVLTQKPWEKIRRYLEVPSLAELMAATAEPKGVMAVIPHIGNWELVITSTRWFPRQEQAVIYQALRNRLIDGHVSQGRSNFGVETIDRKEGFAKSVALLRRAGGLAILHDQHAGDKGVWVPLFGRLCSTTPLPAILAKKTGSIACRVAVRAVGVARWKVDIRFFRFDRKAAIEDITMAFNRDLEELIRRDPAAWFWVHDRWKIPKPRFLLREYKRGVFMPEDAGKLKPFRILIRSGNWLGDAVMSVEAVRRIKRGRPDARVTVLAKRNLIEFWATVPEVDEVIPIEPKEGVFAVAKKLRERFDVAILFPNSPRSGLEAWLAGIPRRVGYRRPWRNFFVNQFIPEPPPPQPVRHQSNDYLRIAERIGADLDGPLPPISVRMPDSLAVGLCPGAEYGPAKRWPYFAEAAKCLSERHGLQWHIFGTAKEQPLGTEIASQLGAAAVNLVGKTTLAELIAELSRCRLLLTNDTGTMHLAAHLGVPTVAIFGSTEPALTGPIGAGHTIIRHRVECSPCFLRTCPIDFRCMRRISVEEVVQAVEKVLGVEVGK
ncbi:MAG: lipopolysaccharide heptosyltransferase II [Verrucomicrobia bacterium]|nr:lipopolysaccharide heptosyltransferase II [Verrucomicrobiota bacterium]